MKWDIQHKENFSIWYVKYIRYMYFNLCKISKAGFLFIHCGIAIFM